MASHLNLRFFFFFFFNHAKVSTHTGFFDPRQYFLPKPISWPTPFFLINAKILWTYANHSTHAKISTHAICLTHSKILWTHATHTTYEPTTLRTHAPTLLTPRTLFSSLDIGKECKMVHFKKIYYEQKNILAF